jgi:hypothetical protein
VPVSFKALDAGIVPGPARSRAKARFLLVTSAVSFKALDPGILPGPARSRAKARFLLVTSATCGGGAHPCAWEPGRALRQIFSDKPLILAT